MSDGFVFRANHKSAPVTVEMRVGWAETATADEVADALTNAYGEAMQQVEAQLGICHL
jgi:hypothetical protein